MEDQFGSSKLGTKEYWDNVYGEELVNFSENSDCGEIWFGEGVVKRVTNWFCGKYGRGTIGCDQRQQVSILDIGTGNGMFLVELSKLGFADLTGVDYSDSAIKLAQAIANEHHASIRYEVGNLLETSVQKCDALIKSYDVCTDKGTFDAVSLDPDNVAAKKRTYVERVSGLLKSDGLLALTSCNWTRDELVGQFSHEFEFFDEIPMLQFQFGGKTGQKVTSLVLKKKLK